MSMLLIKEVLHTIKLHCIKTGLTGLPPCINRSKEWV